MSSLGSPNPFFIAGKKAYEVERSLRFNDDDSAYLTRTPSSASNRKTFTFSAWVKRTGISLNQRIFTAYNGSDHNHECNIQFQSDNKIQINNNYNGSTDTNLKTDRLFRDPSAWYHIVVAVDMTQGTASDRVNLYVNGVQETSFSTENYGTQNYTWFFNNNSLHSIGRRPTSERYFDGYMTEINFIDGLQLTPSSFAETDAVTGEYKPKKFVGSYGTNGFYLNFSDNSGTTATTMGKDSSGNSNNWTPNNFVTSDAVKDSPTNNFCIMNIHDNNLSEASPHFVYSEGNLKAAWSFTGTNFDRVHGSLLIEPHDTNKYYWEMVYEQNNESMMFGVCATDTTAYKANQRNTNPADSSESNIAYLRYQPYQNAPYILKTDASSSYHGSYLSVQGGANVVDGDVLGFVFDRSTGKLYVFHNGNELTNQDYSNNTSVFDTVATDKTYAISLIEGDGGGSTKLGYFIANFGQDSTFAGNKTAQGNTDANGLGDFYHSVPTGAKALCSANLPDPTIKIPNKHFDILTWTGTAASHALTGLNFQPDLFWAKARSQAYHNTIMDSVRGTNKQIWSNRNNAEQTDTSFLTSFNSDGVTLGDNSSGTGATNTDNAVDTYVGWFWNAGGSTVTNNDGSIASQVRANTTAGFSIVTWTGNGSSGATIGHGLGVTPNFAIAKNRSSGSYNWPAVNFDLQTGGQLNTNQTFSNGNYNAYYAAQPSSSVLTLGSHGTTNANTNNYVAYVFSEVAGYSKFGSYTGNQNADGTFVYTGFRPALVITKGTWGSNWNMYDNSRNPYNVSNLTLYPNLNNAESTESSSGNQMDLISNGFKLRGSNNDTNHSADFIYLAFAESPFKYARAR